MEGMVWSAREWWSGHVGLIDVLRIPQEANDYEIIL